MDKANVFFSHAWRFRVVDVVAAMRTFVNRERANPKSHFRGRGIFFWYDVATIDEHASQSAADSKWWEETFKKAVADIGHTCLVSGSSSVCLRRRRSSSP